MKTTDTYPCVSDVRTTNASGVHGATEPLKPIAPDLFNDVGAFHKKFGLDTFGRVKPQLLPPDAQRFREKFLEEELTEFVIACQSQDLANAADALVDLIYVALGTAHMMGIDFNAHWAEVQRANMAKERASGAGDVRSKRKNALDVVKPEGWTPPDHGPIIERAINDYEYVHVRVDPGY